MIASNTDASNARRRRSWHGSSSPFRLAPVAVDRQWSRERQAYKARHRPPVACVATSADRLVDPLRGGPGGGGSAHDRSRGMASTSLLHGRPGLRRRISHGGGPGPRWVATRRSTPTDLTASPPGHGCLRWKSPSRTPNAGVPPVSRVPTAGGTPSPERGAR